MFGYGAFKVGSFEVSRKLRLGMVVAIILLMSAGSSVYNLLMYAVGCFNLGQGQQADEDLFKICEEDERAYLMHSDLWTNNQIFRISFTVMHFIVHPVLPCFALLWCGTILLLSVFKIHHISSLYSTSLWKRAGFTKKMRTLTAEEEGLLKRCLTCCGLKLASYSVSFPGYVHRLWGAFQVTPHLTITFPFQELHYSHPPAVLDLVNHLSHLTALLYPALAVYILCGPDYLPLLREVGPRNHYNDNSSCRNLIH